MRIAAQATMTGPEKREIHAISPDLATRLTQSRAIMAIRENRDSHRGLRQTLA